MPSEITEITEIATALGMLGPDLATTLSRRPLELLNVPAKAWDRLVGAYAAGDHSISFATAFANGGAFLAAVDGLRNRPPRIVEWKGPHRPPGDDVIPADLRVDHVYLISCKYLSKVLLNPSPHRLFDRLLLGEGRSSASWFSITAPAELQALYAASVGVTGLRGFPPNVNAMTSGQQRAIKLELSARTWPAPLQAPWANLCRTVAAASASRWTNAMAGPRDRLRLLWRLLRISTATYFVLGTDHSSHLRYRVDSAWDWMQRYDLVDFSVVPRGGGQPEVEWKATIRLRDDGRDVPVIGHVEVRWSHGRFVGSPEAKVYLDTPHASVPGYHLLV